MKCAMGDNAMNISILEGYPFCAKFPANNLCSSVCLGAEADTSGAFHSHTASLDDKGAPAATVPTSARVPQVCSDGYALKYAW